jgi:hypothetical protein
MSILSNFLESIRSYSSSRVVINGKSYTGRRVNVIDGRVIVDGKDVTPESKTITISVEGNIESLSVDACTAIKISGNVGDLKSGAGDVACENIMGSVESGSGDITCMNVEGNVRTGAGDVTAHAIKGNVSTGAGDIHYEKKI